MELHVPGVLAAHGIFVRDDRRWDPAAMVVCRCAHDEVPAANPVKPSKLTEDEKDAILLGLLLRGRHDVRLIAMRG